MEQFFWRMVDLTISGSIAILGVFAFRWMLRNQQKIFAYILWIIVGIRLLMSISFCGVWGWLSFPFQENAEKNKETIFYTWSRTGEARKGGNLMPEASGEMMGQLFTKDNILKLIFAVWIIGVILLFAKNAAAYFCLKRKVQPSMKETDYYISDNISGAFVLGVISPKIYLSSYLTEEERRYMLAHERIHLKRWDYLWKWVAECICCIHWFNPFVWIAFRAFTADMEMSCDEAVLRKWNLNERAEYARIFLAEVVESREGSIVPFFREGATERRIRNMMKNKKINKKTLGVCAGVVAVAALLLIPGFWEKDSYGKETEKLVEEKRESKDITSGKGMGGQAGTAESEVGLQAKMEAGGNSKENIDITNNGVDISKENDIGRVSCSITGYNEMGYPTSEYCYQMEVEGGEVSEEVSENIGRVVDDIRDTLGGKDIMISYNKDESEKLAIKHGYHTAYTMVFTADLDIPKGAKNKYGLSGKYKDMPWYLVKSDDGKWRIDDADIYHVEK